MTFLPREEYSRIRVQSNFLLLPVETVFNIYRWMNIIQQLKYPHTSCALTGTLVSHLWVKLFCGDIVKSTSLLSSLSGQTSTICSPVVYGELLITLNKQNYNQGPRKVGGPSSKKATSTDYWFMNFCILKMKSISRRGRGPRWWLIRHLQVCIM